MRITEKDKVDIINEYTVNLTTCIELAKKYRVTRQYIYKLLKRCGVDTTKQSVGHLDVSCTVCGKIITRWRVRVKKQKRHFCCEPCRLAWFESLGDRYIPNRNGQRIGRSVVKQYFDLQPEHVVHHVDKNTLNNQLDNLMVFACNGDHVRYHRGFDSYPIWMGRLEHGLSEDQIDKAIALQPGYDYRHRPDRP